MDPVAIGFGIAAALVVALSSLRGRRHPSFGVALMLFGFWVLANLSDPWMDPWMDAAGFYAVLAIWLKQPARWLVVVGAVFISQMLVSLLLVAFPWERQLALNLLLVVALAATAFPGGLHAFQLALRLGGLSVDHTRPSRVHPRVPRQPSAQP